MTQGYDVAAARRWGLIGFGLATGLPALAWHGLVAGIASQFRFDLEYLVTGWTAFALIAFGLALLVPVLVSIGRNPESRLYPHNRNALAAWGTSLYLLGVGLAVQLDQIAGGLMAG